MADDDYRSALDSEGRDLVAQARARRLDPVWHRDAEIATVLAALDRKDSIVLVGPPGAGKSSVLHGAAHAMARRGRGRLVEFSTTGILTGTRYIGEWQTKITRVVEAAIKAGAALVFTDLPLLSTVGSSSKNDSTFLDALRPFIETKRVSLVGEVTPEALRRMQRDSRFADLFVKVEVAPLGVEEVRSVLQSSAHKLGVEIDSTSRDSLLRLTTRFLPARAQPGPALGLLHQARAYQLEKIRVGEEAPLDPALIERVFSIYSGLPPFVVSPTSTRAAGEIRSWFKERLVGQEEAIEAVLEAIALFKSGLNDPSRPIGTFLFVGPTGVGKTELARLLATFLFGSPQRLLRFDMSELKDYHSFEVLLGDAEKPERSAALLDPVRAQPFQVILFDELDKAHPNVFDLLLSLLDEGRLTAPRGDTVDFRSTIFIATSNAGAEESRKALGFGVSPDGEDEGRLRSALDQQFRPEFLNRFQHIAVFRPLTHEQVRLIARRELSRVLEREGITTRNLVVDVDESALDVAIARGFQPRWGARALKREIQSRLVLPVALTLMEKPVEAGQIIRLTAREERVHVQLLETAESRAERREKEPVRGAAGRKWSRESLVAATRAAQERLELTARAADAEEMTREVARLIERRSAPDFWRDAAAASRAIEDMERLTNALDRLTELRTRFEDLLRESSRPGSRTTLSQLVGRLDDIEEKMSRLEVELVWIGPEGRSDLLIEIRPTGAAGAGARDLLVRTYQRWAEGQDYGVEILSEPAEQTDPVFLAITGSYAFGFLRDEAGVHRLSADKTHSAVRVRVAPWVDAVGTIVFESHEALKRTGVYGGKLRSSVVCSGGLILQNAKTLAENRDWASRHGAAWLSAPVAPDTIVRRYDLEPPLVRDSMTGISSGHRQALGPGRFHQLLCARLRIAWERRTSDEC